MSSPAQTGSSSKPNGTATARLASLDALRGFDMFWIVGGGAVVQTAIKASKIEWLQDFLPQFRHVDWEGFHFIDLIFPLFLFMIGVAIPYSFGKRLARGDSRWRIFEHVVVRVAILIFLGMVYNGSLLTYDPGKFELTYSVLQMLALGYLVASILYLSLRLPGQILATLVMLVGYWALLAFVPGPGHEIGKFKEGCNVGDWVTEAIFGKWRGHQVGWVVGILGHASTAMLGVFAGRILRSVHTNPAKVLALALLGVVCLAAGLFWGGWVAEKLPGVTLYGVEWNEWPVWFPVIKNRWTSTFALYAGGWSYLLLALFYQVIDVWGWRRWARFFMVIGANSIFAYLAWGLCGSAFRAVSQVFLGGLKRFVSTELQPTTYSPEWHATVLAAGAFLTFWLLLAYMYRNKTFIRV